MRPRRRRPPVRTVARAVPTVLLALALAACGAGAPRADTSPRSVTLYTCVSDPTAQAVVARFEQRHPGTTVRLFRAPTGELTARIAADVRAGGLRADVVWGCDPLTMRRLAAQGLLLRWTPPDAREVPARFRSPGLVGAHVLYVVAVRHRGAPPIRSWADLARAGSVAVPDPAFAASALGAVAYLAGSPGYGLRWFADLHRAGAVQVSSPDDVTVGVAQGRYDAGITIATSAYQARRDGSPVEVSWPAPGAVAVHGPIAVVRGSHALGPAKSLVSFVVGRDGQATVGRSGSYPVLPGVAGPEVPAGASVVQPDWDRLARGERDLLAGYASVFGG